MSKNALGFLLGVQNFGHKILIDFRIERTDSEQGTYTIQLRTSGTDYFSDLSIHWVCGLCGVGI